MLMKMFGLGNDNRIIAHKKMACDVSCLASHAIPSYK